MLLGLGQLIRVFPQLSLDLTRRSFKLVLRATATERCVWSLAATVRRSV